MSKLENAVLFLKGPIEEPIYDDDMTYPVVPENFFYYLTGCADANTYAIYKVQEERIYLFVKLADATKSFWEKHKTVEDMKKAYHIDDVFKVEQLEEIFLKEVGKDDNIMVYKGTNQYSGLETLNVLNEYQVSFFWIKNCFFGQIISIFPNFNL